MEWGIFKDIYLIPVFKLNLFSFICYLININEYDLIEEYTTFSLTTLDME